VVTGPQTAYRTYAASGTTGIVLARFAPGAASAFLPISMHEIRDRNIDLADLISPADVERVAQQVQAAPDTRHRVARVEAFLRSRLRPDRAAGDTACAVRQIIASGGGGTVGQLAEGLGLSPRQLQRRFRQSVGVGPKALGRIARLQRALDLRDSGLSWGITAHSAGYQDQSHLANDCRALTGLSPEQVFRRRRSTPLGSYYNAGPGAPAFFRTIYL
jgi:AraC-like DNA-binding protein